MPDIFHEPVMVSEVLEALRPRRGGIVIDGTLGSGGHARELAARVGSEGVLIGLDRDPAMLRAGRERLEGAGGADSPRMIFAARPYEQVREVMQAAGLTRGADAILLDLGVNSLQLDAAERGFSFQKEGPLDGRFNPEEGTETMAELLNRADEKDLARIFRTYGDERLATPIARKVVAERRREPIRTTTRFADLVASVYPPAQRHGRIHPATRCMQALRIAVNDELGAVERGARACLYTLAPGGVLAVLTFHSGEDRIVKELFREASSPRPDPSNPYSATTMEGVEFHLPFRKARKCSAAEAQRNPRARSAKLRAIERLPLEVPDEE